MWSAIRGRDPRRQPEPLFQLAGLEVAEADSEGVGGMRWLGCFRHVEQGLDHNLHLTLVGVPVARHAGLDLARGIAAHFNLVLLRGEKNYTTNLGKPEGGPHI